MKETVTVGMVSCILLCWGVVLQVILALTPYSSELLFPAGVDLPPGFLQCVRVCRPRAGPTHTPGTEAPKNKETCSLALLEIPSF